MPVQAHGGGVVFELAAGRVEDGLDKVLHGFPRVHFPAARHYRRDVDAVSVALQHAVGEEHQPVPRLKRQRLHTGLVATHDPERRVGRHVHALHEAVA